jgi:hypothetical protein
MGFDNQIYNDFLKSEVMIGMLVTKSKLKYNMPSCPPIKLLMGILKEIFFQFRFLFVRMYGFYCEILR